MTQTTTELLAEAIASVYDDRCGPVDALVKFAELHDRLSSGEPLPDQWRGKSDRDVVERWMFAVGKQRSLHVTLDEGDDDAVSEFTGATPDEAYRLAAEWVRGQDA